MDEYEWEETVAISIDDKGGYNTTGGRRKRCTQELDPRKLGEVDLSGWVIPDWDQ